MRITFQGSLVKSRGKLKRAAPKLVLKRAPAAFVGDLEADIGGGFWGGFGPPSPCYCGKAGASRSDLPLVSPLLILRNGFGDPHANVIVHSPTSKEQHSVFS